MRIPRRSLFSLVFSAAIFAATAQAAKLPEKLRILSCDLANVAIQTTSGPNNATTDLKRLLDKADPDIVFLQHVADWEACDRICKLRPGLRVLTCSAFNGDSIGQVAILARDKAALSWVDEVSSGNGFAFALIEAGPRKIGVFSIEARDSSAATDRIIGEVKKLQGFAKNRPDSFIIAGPSLAKAALAESGFETIASDAQPPGKNSASEFWTANVGFLSRPRALTIAGVSKPILITDVDTANTFSSKFAYQNVLLFPGESPAPVAAVLQPASAAPKSFPLATTTAVCVVALLLAAFAFGRRKQSMALVPVNDLNLRSADPAFNDPVRLGLLAWFKSVFMQRLIADRRKMIADEADATRRTLAIEQKLSELQISLQDRISAYENRIARLESELSAATFENRELIRNQINDLKEKVAKAKGEFSYRRN
jgi:hypothetical protein